MYVENKAERKYVTMTLFAHHCHFSVPSTGGSVNVCELTSSMERSIKSSHFYFLDCTFIQSACFTFVISKKLLLTVIEIIETQGAAFRNTVSFV